MEIKTCMLTNNDCYKDARKMSPVGIIVHSTGANNPYLKRYVQPDDGILGVNTNNNSWNKPGTDKCVHAMIGKDKNGVVRCYQTLPWDYCCWGIGRGSKGSYNYPPTSKYPNDRPFIQFEICEDGLTDVNYFNTVMDLAQEFCAFLMQTFPAIKLEDVISHHEGYLRQMGSGHMDIDHWLSKFNKDMNWFRSCVKSKLGNTATSTPTPTPAPTATTTFKDGDVVKLVEGATYYDGRAIPTWVTKSTLFYRGTNKNGVIISTQKTGAVTGTVKPESIVGYTSTPAKAPVTTSTPATTYKVDTTKLDTPKSFDAAIAGTYVTTTTINTRSGASAVKTLVAKVPKNQVMTVEGYYTSSLGVKWYVATFVKDNVQYKAFVHSKYLVRK